MKSIFFIVAILATSFLQKSFAQDVPEKTDDTTIASAQSQLSELLTSYYYIKDALIVGDPKDASKHADDFLKTANNIDGNSLSKASRKALIKDATAISESKDLKHQREHFADFSIDMYSLVKAVHLTAEPVYYLYCPMKNAYWLSDDKAVKNPYYGSAMLTCGSVKETIK